MAVSNPQVKSAEPTKAPCNGAIPPLENGDRLTRAEFERRYEAMPKLKKAELIEGEVYMPSPVRQRRHSHPHTRLVTWLGNYETDTPGVEAGANGSIRLDVDSALERRGAPGCQSGECGPSAPRQELSLDTPAALPATAPPGNRHCGGRVTRHPESHFEGAGSVSGRKSGRPGFRGRCHPSSRGPREPPRGAQPARRS